ncbi:MAG: protein translocase subunit SecF, partial [Mucispirillum sp.]|nr:protein translocase subunit SecF [Mucispirillum sp.]
MFELIKTGTNIDFIGRAKIYFTVSLLLCAAALVLVFMKGFNYGVDFSGGTSVQVTFEKPADIDKMRSAIDKAVPGSISIQSMGEGVSFRIKAEQSKENEDLKAVADTINNVLATQFSESGKVTVDSVEQVGPQVGKDLKRQAFMAVLYAVIGILIYIAVRFEMMSAAGTIIALIHDIILTLSVIIACGITFDLTVLAALLTVVGYSLNDKIVIFDRIRERSRADADKPLMGSMN